MPQIPRNSHRPVETAVVQPNPAPVAWGTVLQFATIFLVVAAAGFGFEYYCMTYDSVRTYRGWVAAAGAAISRVAGYDAQVSGTMILTMDRSLEVTPECAALDVLAIFFAGVLAFPTTGRRRIWGLVIGAVGISLSNVVRIAALSAMAASRPDWFDAAHEFFMHAFPLVSALPLWLLWLIVIVRPGAANRRASVAASSPQKVDG